MTAQESQYIRCTRLDGHVHLHPRFEVGAFLDHAATNAQGNAVLCFTECAGIDRFEELRSNPRAGEWIIDGTQEPDSIVASRGAERIILIAGRQVITAERLEVLALATNATIDEGQALDATIDAAHAAGAVPVLPWAFGKWWGSRGRIVADCIERRTDIFIADQAGRPMGTPEPDLIERARGRGIVNIPGSDPLNLSRHVARPASYGCTLTDGGSETFQLDARSPASDLRSKLANLTASPPVRGSRVSPAKFVRDQIALRMVKRVGGRP